LLRRVQCLLGLLALGDVLRRAKQAEAVTIHIVFRTQLDLHPADLSIGPHPAVFNLRRRPYCDRTAARIEKGGDVVRVNKRPRFLDRQHRFWRNADELEHLRRPGCGLGRLLGVPMADLADPLSLEELPSGLLGEAAGLLHLLLSEAERLF
jgi:hypothetical protein